MLQDMQLVGHSFATQHSYLRAVRQLVNYCRTAPEQITEDQLRRFLLHLRNEKQHAAGTLKVAYQGIRFFYTTTLPRDWPTLKQLKVPRQRTLPAVLSRDEVRQLLDAVETPHNRAFLNTVYSLGLRLQEALYLQVGDINADRMLVHVHRGKGAKDRYVPLPAKTLQVLRKYWATHRNQVWLFPATGRNHQQATTADQPMAAASVQGCIQKVVQQLGWSKRRVSLHTLRHSYATHLLESRVNLRLIQKYLGHSSLMNTTLYLHLTTTGEEQARTAIEGLVS
jgi:site-specific recombinase XerD